MKKRAQIKPSKQASIVQMIGGAVFVVIGLTVAIPTMSNGGPVWFGVLWTCMAATIAVTGAINAFSEKGIPTEEIVSDWSEPEDTRSTEGRLRELEEMRRTELISEAEYAETRKKILNEH